MYLIVDANVLLGSVLGRSIVLLEELAASGTIMLVPEQMMREASLIVADRERVAVSGAEDRLRSVATTVTTLDSPHFDHEEARARERLSAAGQKDWPLLAASLALDAPIWSNDKHLWGTGVAVWRTRNISFFAAALPRELSSPASGAESGASDA